MIIFKNVEIRFSPHIKREEVRAVEHSLSHRHTPTCHMHQPDEHEEREERVGEIRYPPEYEADEGDESEKLKQVPHELGVAPRKKPQIKADRIEDREEKQRTTIGSEDARHLPSIQNSIEPTARVELATYSFA